MVSITDDRTMEAALYGTSGRDAQSAFRTIGELEKRLEASLDMLISALDLELAAEIVDGGLFDAELTTLTDETALTLMTMRDIERRRLAIDLLHQWRRDIDARARRVGAAEHAVRMHVSGAVDDHWKDAQIRFRRDD